MAIAGSVSYENYSWKPHARHAASPRETIVV